ncbi:MAG: hypothetical protein JO235_21705 [Chroococcidiopsidaceae cyanobacterium CP_BM_RX_35]|nr:hypothetical protein [Chroococcidiopsidaceae cyanobacterium CP_BM_RX_35]
MGLLGRILQKLYLIGLTIIKASRVDGTYENQMLVWIVNSLTILALVGGFVLTLSALVWAMSLEIFVKALLLAYLLAWLWSKFGQQFTSFAQELYLMGATVGYTVLTGADIQIQRMPWADGKALLVYWTCLLILGVIIWGITVRHTTRLAGEPQKIEYKQHFRSTKVTKKISTLEQAQVYLKRMK